MVASDETKAQILLKWVKTRKNKTVGKKAIINKINALWVPVAVKKPVKKAPKKKATSKKKK